MTHKNTTHIRWTLEALDKEGRVERTLNWLALEDKPTEEIEARAWLWVVFNSLGGRFTLKGRNLRTGRVTTLFDRKARG